LANRHGGAAAPDRGDDLTAIPCAFAHGGGASIVRLAEIVAVAVGAAGADRQRAGGVRGAERSDENESRSETARGAAQNPDHVKPLTRERRG
jgi:hypothetical protein